MIATIVVTWNQTELTLQCLTRLVETGFPQNQIWVVDNGSEPSAAPLLRERFPHTKIIRLDDNQGFAGGMNAGVSAALLSRAQTLFLLNNDAMVEPQTIPALQAALEEDSRIAAVSPKVYYDNTPHLIQSIGLRVDPNSGEARMLGSGEADCGQYDQPADREALFGCAMLIRASAWEQVGPFWEPFFSYGEEIDWCLRARKQGWRLRYVPGAVVWHRTSSSLGADAPLKVYLMARNRLYLRSRHRQQDWRGWFGLALVIYRSLRVLIRMILRGQRAHAWAMVLAWLDFWRGRQGNARSADLRLRR